MFEVAMLALGLIALWIGAELAIQGALDIGRHYRISHTFMGLTILALGTDLPELFVVVSASLKRLVGIETSGLVLGETISTCFSQVGLTLGIIGLITVVKVKKREIQRDGFMLIGSAVLLFLLSFNGFISRTEGWVLLFAYAAYFLVIIREEHVYRKFRLFRPRMHLLWSLSSMLGGFALLVVGAQFTINNALLLSQQWNIAQHFMGILVVGLGTSIPELATSLTAVRHGAKRMAVANLFGSNILDILFILGLGSAISGFTVHPSLIRYDIPALLLLSVAVVIFLLWKFRLQKWQAIVLIGAFVVYYGFRLVGVFTMV